MKLVRIEKGSYPHKFKAVFSSGTTTNFGFQPMQDYTQHGDKDRRRLYRARHEKDLETQDPTRAGYLSYYILWGDSTNIHKNITDFKRRFNL
jgi:hypothetical protein